jgi:UDP-glucuronate 4-epimerase
MPNNVLITGGAGFIGSHLCEKLLKNRNKIVIVDNFDNYYDPKIKKRNISKIIKNKNVKFYETDILSLYTLSEIFKKEKCEKIVHLAAKVGVLPSLLDPHSYERVNLLGTLNLLELSKHYGVKHFIFASSSSVYGETKVIPFREDDLTIKPISPYGVTKLSGEYHCYFYSKTYGIPITCLRFFTVYGPRQRPEMAIHKFIRNIFNKQQISIYGNGNSSRDYTYIDDIINGIVKCFYKPNGFEIYNLGNSHPIKIIKLIRIIEEMSKLKAKVKFISEKMGDIKNTFADISKATKKLSYNPKTDIKEGIEKFIYWYKKECL